LPRRVVSSSAKVRTCSVRTARGGQQLVEVTAVVVGQLAGPAHDPADEATRWRGCALVLGAALVEVAHQQVGAAGVAQLADLFEQPGHRHAGVVGQPATQVVTVGVDQGAAVAWWPLQLFGGGGAGVALDGVQRPTQPACTFEQAHTLAEQLVHGRVPGPGPLVDRPHGLRRLLRLRRLPRRRSSPAGAVRDDGLLHRPAQAVPQVPAVADLHRLGCALADRLGVGGRPVAADDLGAGCSRSHAVRVAALRSGSTSIRRWVTASISMVT